MSLTRYIYFNNDVSWNQRARHIIREFKVFSDVVALPKQGNMLREN